MNKQNQKTIGHECPKGAIDKNHNSAYKSRQKSVSDGKLCCLFVQYSKYASFLGLFFDKWLKNFISSELDSSTKLME